MPIRVNETQPKKSEIKANPIENPKKYISYITNPDI